MAKRFVDTTLGRKAWFRRLSPKLKCAYRFLLDECDEAGVWSVDVESMAFHVGESLNLKEAFAAINAEEGRISWHGADKVVVHGFIPFQYGADPLSPACKPHLKVIVTLKRHGLWEEYEKGNHTLSHRVPERVPDRVKEEEEDKEEEEEKKKGGVGENNPPPPPPATEPPPVVGLDDCIQAWRKSLAWSGAPREPTEAEKFDIGRAIQRTKLYGGAANVELALLGAQHEPESPTYKPKKYCRLSRVIGFDPTTHETKFFDFLNWGVAAKEREKARAAPSTATPPIQVDLSDAEVAANREQIRTMLAGGLRALPGGAS